MGRKILDFTRHVATSGDYPYGGVKNDPSGTLVDETAMGDIFQFFARIAADAGVTLNSLPDNVTNGFQYVQALNTLYGRRFNGMASAFGTPTGTFVPVVVSGMVYSTISTTYTVTPGFCFYNGMFYYCSGGSGSTVVVGWVPVISFSVSDGQPICSVANATSVTAGAGSCNFSAIVPWSAAVGITSGAWTTVAPSTGWTVGASAGLISAPIQYKTDKQRVWLRGNLIPTTTTPSLMTVLPIPPAQTMYFAVVNEGTGSASVSIDAYGNVRLVTTQTGGYSISLDGITFFVN